MASTCVPARGVSARLEGTAASNSGVRPASRQDAAARLAIYRPCVLDTPISWEIDVPAVADMAARIDGLRATHEWLILERDDQIVGFAYGQPLKRLLHSNGPLRPVCVSTFSITAPAWPGCNSICWTLLIRMDRPARFTDRGRRHPGR
jgi:hypothetical protein